MMHWFWAKEEDIMADELLNPEQFSRNLFEKMKQFNPGIKDLEYYGFV